MHRVLRALFVALLAATLSGAVSLVAPEPCGPNESSDATHSTCPPTCVRCGCCRQPVLQALPVVAVASIAPMTPASVEEQHVVSADPREILHVPKSL